MLTRKEGERKDKVRKEEKGRESERKGRGDKGSEGKGRKWIKGEKEKDSRK